MSNKEEHFLTLVCLLFTDCVDFYYNPKTNFKKFSLLTLHQIQTNKVSKMFFADFSFYLQQI
jgi:hypothetical protein